MTVFTTTRAASLSGRNVLLSRDFYYFGSRAIELPDFLRPICHQTQGHRSEANAPYFHRFVEWLRGLDLMAGQLYAGPITWLIGRKCGLADRARPAKGTTRPICDAEVAVCWFEWLCLPSFMSHQPVALSRGAWLSSKTKLYNASKGIVHQNKWTPTCMTYGLVFRTPRCQSSSI